MEATFTIKSVAQMTNLNPHTIRAWERRYQALSPSRHGNGRRLYSMPEVERLKLLVTLVNNGHSISSIASLGDTVLQSMQDSNQDNSSTLQDSTDSTRQKSTGSATHHVLMNILHALEQYDLVMINSELEAARLLLTAKQFVLLLAVPLLQQVGQLVALNRISVAQEHSLSAVLRSQLMQILFNARNTLAMRSFTRKDLPKGKVFAIATQEGDLHEFGALAASILIAVNGHVPHYFGANMPAKALADAANAIKADVIVIGVTFIPSNLRVMTEAEYCETLARNLARPTQIFWGGHVTFDDDFQIGHNYQIFKSLNDLDQHLIDTFPHKTRDQASMSH